MRHIVGVIVGLVGTAVGTLVLATGYWWSFQALQRLELDQRWAGAGVLLAGGVVLGLVVLARRLSALAPLTGGLLLAGATVVDIALPGIVFPYSGARELLGLVTFIGSGSGLALGVVLIAAAFSGGRRTPAPVVPEPSSYASPYPPRRPGDPSY